MVSRGGNYKIFYTGNNGTTWTYQTLVDGDNIDSASCIYFNDNTTGWLGTANENLGYIYHTTDTCNTWNKQAEYDKPIYDIFMINKNEGWAVSENVNYIS